MEIDIKKLLRCFYCDGYRKCPDYNPTETDLYIEYQKIEDNLPEIVQILNDVEEKSKLVDLLKPQSWRE